MKNKTGILINGSIRSAGITLYTKQGQTIVRSSKSHQPPRRTLAQFKSRERFAHNNSLWEVIKDTSIITYAQFCALAAKLPVLYLTHDEHFIGYTLLLPGIPVACGTLPDIGYRLGDVDGVPALLTDLAPTRLAGGDSLTLVTLRQLMYGGQPQLTATACEVTADDITVVGGCVALTGGDFGDSDRGWALVRRHGAQCSSQTVVTACRRYLAYTTDDALQRAAASYGGLTPPP